MKINLMDKLSRHVSDGPNGMPRICLYELNGIILQIKKLSNRIDEYALAC